MIDGLQIGILRAPAGDVSARLPLERALGAADLRPPGLSAGAVLIVRRLVTERPDTGRAWERAARAQLAELCRRAARPARGESAAHAEAVLFADEAELLACLADDCVADVAAGRWWWRSYLRGRPAGVAQLPALLARLPAVLPAALSLLVARGRAAAVLCALRAPAARALAERLAATYGLGALPLSTALAPASPAPPRGPEAEHVPGAVSEGVASPPWPTLLPDLPREQQLLLGLALAVLVRPTAPRSPVFRRALAAWWQAAGRGELPPPAAGAARERAAVPATADRVPPVGAPMPHPVERPAGDLPLTPAATVPRPAPGRQSTQQGQRSTVAGSAMTAQPQGGISPVATPAPPHRPAQVGVPTRTAVSARSDLLSHTASLPSGSAALPVTPSRLPAAPSAPDPAGAPAHSDAPPDKPAPAPALAPSWRSFESGQPTELGGALLLINLLIYLGLPEQFAPAWPLERAVGAWALLELFARSLLAVPAAYTDDPLWSALALLDGRRPGAAPGAGARATRMTRRGHPRLPRLRRAPLAGAARDYRIPAAWLRGLPDDPSERFRWAAGRRRLRVWSSRGYVLFDGRARRPGRAAARAVLAGLGLAGRPLARSRFDRSPAGGLSAATEGAPAWLRRWLCLALPYVRLRLALALGLDRSEALDRPLLARRGRLFVSATHIDLAMSLEASSVAVRLAGLDRNPGWIAEYGRVVLFHFVAPGEQEVWR